MAGTYQDLNKKIDDYLSGLRKIDDYMDAIYEKFAETGKMAKISSEHCIVELGQKTQTMLDDWVVCGIQADPDKFKQALLKSEIGIKILGSWVTTDSSPSIGQFDLSNHPISASKIRLYLGGPRGDLSSHTRQNFKKYKKLVIDQNYKSRGDNLIQSSFFDVLDFCTAFRNHVAHRSRGSASQVNKVVVSGLEINGIDKFKRANGVSKDLGSYLNSAVHASVPAQQNLYGGFCRTRLGVLLRQMSDGVDSLRL